ncbi:hypothetical protein, partial [Escherichia coli]|uniref:hypothetical protein n=1 Tax=Escherichia coli TaxID=562 RepID=UPI001962D589
ITVADLLAQADLEDELSGAGYDVGNLGLTESGWTLVLLEDLKPDAEELREGRLKWVLSTAMPLVSGFKVFLQGDKVESSKQDT